MQSGVESPSSNTSVVPELNDRALRLAWYLVADLRAEPDALIHLERGVLLPALEKVARELNVSLRTLGAVETIEAHFALKYGDQPLNTLWLSWMGVSAANRIMTLVRSAETSLGVVLRSDQVEALAAREAAGDDLLQNVRNTGGSNVGRARAKANSRRPSIAVAPATTSVRSGGADEVRSTSSKPTPPDVSRVSLKQTVAPPEATTKKAPVLRRPQKK